MRNIVNPRNVTYLLPMRLRVPELLKKRGLTAYALASKSSGRISMTMAYAYSRTGAFRCLSPEQIEGLCEVLGVEPGELFERRPAAKKSKRG